MEHLTWKDEKQVRWQKLGALLALLTVTTLGTALGQDQPPAAGEKGAPALPVAEVPAGVTIPVELKSTISSHTAYPGQPVYCVTNFPITLEEKMMIPGGSYLKGQITRVVQPGKLTGKAQLGVKFDAVVLPSGVTRPLSAKIISLAGSKLDEPGDSGSKDPGETIIDGGILAASTSLSSAASQGVTGMMFSMATKDKSIALASGMDMEIRLTSVVTIPLPPPPAPPESAKTQAASADESEKPSSSETKKPESVSGGSKKPAPRKKSP
jgi:hypothetical protein